VWSALKKASGVALGTRDAIGEAIPETERTSP
jgi:hypothetical protein